MRVLPILFNTDMVRAILDGRKTVTRRLIKHDIEAILNSPFHLKNPEVSDKQIISKLCQPPYEPGDILYVRETWGIRNLNYDDKIAYIVYKASENEKDEGCIAVNFADDKFEKLYDSMAENSPDWRPSIHMPKEAARIWIKVKDVRVKRVQEITLDDILNEGVSALPEAFNDPDNAYMQSKKIFSELWNSTIKKNDLEHYGYDVNPWVWVIEFERCDKPGKEAHNGNS